MLDSGDLIFHPRGGFGTIRGLTRRELIQPAVGGKGASDPAQEYYEIQLLEGGTLFVPVNRAKRLGLRLLTNGLDAITVCLHSPAVTLPGDARLRANELWVRCQTDDPTALAASVRDMVTQNRGRTLTTSEKEWLNTACERLSTEAALVDHIPRSQARASIREIVKQLSTL